MRACLSIAVSGDVLVPVLTRHQDKKSSPTPTPSTGAVTFRRYGTAFSVMPRSSMRKASALNEPPARTVMAPAKR